MMWPISLKLITNRLFYDFSARTSCLQIKEQFSVGICSIFAKYFGNFLCKYIVAILSGAKMQSYGAREVVCANMVQSSKCQF